jgi:hypothetical protein
MLATMGDWVGGRELADHHEPPAGSDGEMRRGVGRIGLGVPGKQLRGVRWWAEPFDSAVECGGDSWFPTNV